MASRRRLLGNSSGPLMPPRGPSSQAGLVYPPPPVVIPPVGAPPPGSVTTEQSIANPTTPVLSIPLPVDQPIPGATEFQQFCLLSVSGTATTSFTLTSGITVGGAAIGSTNLLGTPINYNGVIKALNIFAGAPGAGLGFTTQLYYTLLLNGAPIPGYANRSFFGRNASSVEQPFDCTIRIPDSSVITATIQDVDGGAYDVGLFFTGWIWPTTLGVQWISGAGQYNGV